MIKALRASQRAAWRVWAPVHRSRTAISAMAFMLGAAASAAATPRMYLILLLGILAGIMALDTRLSASASEPSDPSGLCSLGSPDPLGHHGSMITARVI